MTDKISIYDHSTGEQIERDMTPDEQKEYDLEVAINAQLQADRELKAQIDRDLKISAYTKLGLSDEEIETLLPTPKPIKH